MDTAGYLYAVLIHIKPLSIKLMTIR